MLHVTNGDSAIPVLRAGGVTGEILPWRDVLHDGPVPALPWPELRRARATFIASRGWANEPEVLRSLEERDGRLLEALDRGEEIRLWFEHDLYDQLQLIQVVAMAAPSLRRGARATLVQADDYLGTMAPTAIRDLAQHATAVTPSHVAVAESAWRAFTADRLGPLEEFAHGIDGGDEPFPYVRPALQRLLQEVPNAVTGLSRSELQTLRALATGPRTPTAAFTASHHDAESPIWLGDASFFALLDVLAAGSHPLVRRDGEKVALTADGRAVLDGRRSRASLCGYDRWIGGTHLVRRPDVH